MNSTLVCRPGEAVQAAAAQTPVVLRLRGEDQLSLVQVGRQSWEARCM